MRVEGLLGWAIAQANFAKAEASVVAIFISLACDMQQGACFWAQWLTWHYNKTSRKQQQQKSGRGKTLEHFTWTEHGKKQDHCSQKGELDSEFVGHNYGIWLSLSFIREFCFW